MTKLFKIISLFGKPKIIISENEIYFVNDGEFKSEKSFNRNMLVSRNKFKKLTGWGEDTLRTYGFKKSESQIDLAKFVEQEKVRKPKPRAFFGKLIGSLNK